MKTSRSIGTTDGAISKAESELNVVFPLSFRAWLRQNNGLRIGDITIFPVYDDRDPRKTWDSIVRNFNEEWASWIRTLPRSGKEFLKLIPFGEFGTGDYFCFNYSATTTDNEPTVVLWSHETGEHETVADSFATFVSRASKGELFQE